MTNTIESLQARYGHAVFQITRYQKVAELLKQQIEQRAVELARVNCREDNSLAEPTQDSILVQSAATPSPSMDTPEQSSAFSRAERSEFSSGGRYHGIYPRVFKRTGIQIDLLKKVVRGLADDEAITALRAEMDAIDSERVVVSPELARPLSANEVQACKRNERYGGIYRRVAAVTGVHESFVNRVVKGQRRNDGILAAIRHDMQQVDQRLDAAAQKQSVA